MKRNKLLLFWLVLRGFLDIQAQDLMPQIPLPGTTILPSKKLNEYKFIPDTIKVSVALPEMFINVGENNIIDERGILIPFLEKLRLDRLGVIRDSIRILHIGDSHVRGHIFPRTTGEKLSEIFGAVHYEDMGVNGATCITFTHPERIAEIKEKNPELIILSFGTNESHNRRYSANVHYNQMDELVKLLRNNLPGVAIMFTTPPGSYESVRQRNRRGTYTVNPRTAIAVSTIKRYAREHGLAVWDMYSVVGGKEYACKNWQAAKLMRPDHVHYMPEAYKLQGELLLEAIINSYTGYVFDGY